MEKSAGRYDLARFRHFTRGENAVGVIGWVVDCRHTKGETCPVEPVVLRCDAFTRLRTMCVNVDKPGQGRTDDSLVLPWHAPGLAHCRPGLTPQCDFCR